ncbi:DUF1543 domain-containing protein [Pseudomonas juntendi]|jgi:hypothetical protein|uniref:DUF1543 domain-containing protein n=1 Tax=Pseudomonas juntendi TaxID=2666183 RepID=A0ABD4YE15_9PSED|nr:MULTISPECIES: DUF1543 domain-containing protein [Pseudomonas]MBH3374918.1 DUF1543 domain-containing protein [Pseudomonas juntendi]MBH3386387.1 DUF1543 domain-containing protein [Pseudomonas juntendi]MBS6038835.1 DUF1543 domain-containing protein [Pseudomonas sp.]MDG9875155.1 DUF1543 domain-containing protein [Pseudomonas juntendi]MDH0757348.1 DUF1543 domain-containing protein [Pseudomonas juntendi]
MLFVVLLGGKHPQAKIEVHDIVFAAADTLEQAYPQLRDGWFGSPKGVHVDAWMAVDGVDNWRVELSPLAPSPESLRLYFINLGGYDAQAFGEAHDYLLVVARDKREAMAKGKKQAMAHWSQAHNDAVLDVDDCLPIDQVGGRFVHLVEGPHAGVRSRNQYIVL